MAMVGQDAMDVEGLSQLTLPRAGRVQPFRALARCGGAAGQQMRRLFASIGGIVTMIVTLSVLATLPILQFLSLGYLLRISADVARSGRWQSALRDLPHWSHLGVVSLAAGLLFLPLRLLADFRDSARLLENEALARQLQVWLVAATLLWVGHLSWAVYRGGRFWHFLWPAPRALWRRIRAGGTLAEARDRAAEWLAEWQLARHFWLGLRGFGVAFVWLAGPVSLMVAGSTLHHELAPLLALLGGFLLAWLMLYLPFLQVNLALDDHCSSGFDVRRVRTQFRRAPLACGAAIALSVVLAVPLYALKAELIPREAAWLPSLVFVTSILPARLFVGWALGRSLSREQPRHAALRWAAWLTTLPIVAGYALVVYLTQHVCWYGAWSLYEQHAVLLPVPFMGY